MKTNLRYQQFTQLHPMSFKALKKGHYWVTKDSFSDQFDQGCDLLWSIDKNQSKMTLLHDPDHPRIKARLWKTGANQKPREFISELSQRLKQCIVKNLRFCEQRDNVFLAFGEKDQLPGLNILKLKNHILIQSNCYFWTKHKSLLEFHLKKILKENNIRTSKIHFQMRDHQNREKPSPEKNAVTKLIIEEFGLKYKIKISQFYDVGIYTDMSFIRSQLNDYIKGRDHLLNLFSYTGAFSLYALKNGVKNVTSVDLSQTYMNWLEQNLSLNENLAQNHTSLVMKAETALEQFKREGKKFDFIICDPPSFSSNGKKSASALKQYPLLLEKMEKVLTDSGKAMCVLNTHHIPMKKFREMIEGTKMFKIIKSLKPGQDCTSVRGLPESQYLKVLLIEKDLS